jgi:hypothetical protein
MCSRGNVRMGGQAAASMKYSHWSELVGIKYSQKSLSER